MKSSIAIYLAGSIKKGHENPNESFWAESDIAFLREKLSDYEVSFLNPAFRTDDLSDQHSVFGRDMTQIFCSHVVFVDARDRRGLGVGAEMMWAKVNKIPVVTWAPKNTHYKKDQATILDVDVENFIHPFVDGLSDKVVNDLTEGVDWIRSAISNAQIEVKGIDHIREAMDYYKKKQLHLDAPMKELLSLDSLKARMMRKPPEIIHF